MELSAMMISQVILWLGWRQGVHPLLSSATIYTTELGFQPQDTKKSVYGEIILK